MEKSRPIACLRAAFVHVLVYPDRGYSRHVRAGKWPLAQFSLARRLKTMPSFPKGLWHCSLLLADVWFMFCQGQEAARVIHPALRPPWRFVFLIVQRSISFRSESRPDILTPRPWSRNAAPSSTKRRDSKLWSETFDVCVNQMLTSKEIKRQEVGVGPTGLTVYLAAGALQVYTPFPNPFSLACVEGRQMGVSDLLRNRETSIQLGGCGPHLKKKLIWTSGFTKKVNWDVSIFDPGIHKK